MAEMSSDCSVIRRLINVADKLCKFGRLRKRPSKIFVHSFVDIRHVGIGRKTRKIAIHQLAALPFGQILCIPPEPRLDKPRWKLLRPKTAQHVFGRRNSPIGNPEFLAELGQFADLSYSRIGRDLGWIEFRMIPKSWPQGYFRLLRRWQHARRRYGRMPQRARRRQEFACPRDRGYRSRVRWCIDAMRCAASVGVRNRPFTNSRHFRLPIRAKSDLAMAIICRLRSSRCQKYGSSSAFRA